MNFLFHQFKSVGLAIILTAMVAQSHAQANRIVGSYWTEAAGFTFSSVDLQSASHMDLDRLDGVGGLLLGETTYDRINHRYIQSTDRGLLVIDAENGAILSAIDNPIHMKGIEWSPTMNLLVGTYWTGTHELFVTLDLTNRNFTPLDTLRGVQWLAAGESSYDAVNDRYFNVTIELGILVIDAYTGTILESIPNPKNVKGLEYNPTTGQIMGSYWNGTNEIFTTLDLSTKAFTDLRILTDVQFLMSGESAYDPVNDWYVNRTNLGFTLIMAQYGAIFQTIPDTRNLTGIELMRSTCELGFTRQPESKRVAINRNVQFIVGTSADPVTYQWQINTGEGFMDLTNTGQFSGATDDTLSISMVTLENNSQSFRCIIQSGSCKAASAPANLEVRNAVSISGDSGGDENEEEDLEDDNTILATKQPLDLLIFPNPTADQVTIQSNEKHLGTRIQLFDSSGRLVIKSRLDSRLITLSLTQLPKGLYFLQMEGSPSIKLIKN